MQKLTEEKINKGVSFFNEIRKHNPITYKEHISQLTKKWHVSPNLFYQGVKLGLIVKIKKDKYFCKLTRPFEPADVRKCFEGMTARRKELIDEKVAKKAREMTEGVDINEAKPGTLNFKAPEPKKNGLPEDLKAELRKYGVKKVIMESEITL